MIKHTRDNIDRETMIKWRELPGDALIFWFLDIRAERDEFKQRIQTLTRVLFGVAITVVVLMAIVAKLAIW